MLSQTSDVSAVVLTLGEVTTDLAIASVQSQTFPVREIVTVQDVRPFYKALTAGVEKVSSPFFVQVDADMILDPVCLQQLRQAVRHNTGIVVGHLRDGLIGEVVGIKLFRKECFTAAAMPDSISPDTDFGRKLHASGWKTVELGGPRFGARGELSATMGEHRPSYTIPYTYAKFRLAGRRYRYRRSMPGIRWHFDRLENSSHTAALVAQIGLSQGIFLDDDRDLTGSSLMPEEFAPLEAFLKRAGGPASSHLDIPLHGAANDIFRLCYERGRRLFLADDPSTFARVIASLRTRTNDRAWVAKIGLCRGLVSATPNETSIDEDYRVLGTFLVDDESAFTHLKRFKRKLRRLLLHPRSLLSESND